MVKYNNIIGENYSIIEYNKIIKIEHKKCGEIFDIENNLLYHRLLKYKNEICTICNPINNKISAMEIDLYNYIKSVYTGKILQSSRKILKGKELDIYLPELNIAFEFNGLYWHSNANKSNNYHLNKTIECENNGIELIHIYEDEWVYNKDKIKNKIKNKITKNIFLNERDCVIKEIKLNKSLLYQKEYGIRNPIKSKYTIGLYYNNILTSFVLITKNMNTNKYNIISHLDITDTIYQNSISLMVDYFVSNYKADEIYLSVDRNWINKKDNKYTEIGFSIIHYSEPDYTYVIDNKRYNKTDYKIFYKNYKIYDTGKINYILKIF